MGRRKAAAASLGSGQAEGTGAAEPGDTAAAADAGHPSSSPPPALPSSSFSPPSPSAGADRERSGEAIPGRFRGSRAGRHREERRPLPGGPAPPPAPRPLSAPRPGLGGEGPAAAPARLPAAAAGSARMSGGGSREEERRKLADIINHWNANRLDLFEISAPTEDLEFHGVMRFYFQDKAAGNFATKCIRVSSTATTQDVIETLAEKFRPDMRMLSSPKYSLYEVHVSGG